MIDVWKEERCVTYSGTFCFWCWFYHYGLSKHIFFVCEGQLMKVVGFIFSGGKEKTKTMWNFAVV